MSHPSIINLENLSDDDDSVVYIEETYDNDYDTTCTGKCSFCTYRNVTSNKVFTCTMCGLPNEPITVSSLDDTDIPMSSSSPLLSSSSSFSSSTVTSATLPLPAMLPTKDTNNPSSSSSSTSTSPSTLTYSSEKELCVTRNVISQLQRQVRYSLESIAPSLLPYTLVLASDTDHYAQFDGYSCGYRNIQILCSALLRKPIFRNVLFGGCGYVPDIVSLQRLIEYAWSVGFDPVGYQQLKTILFTNKFIGSTECAIVLRLFGIPAQVIAFHSLDDPLFDEIVKKQTSRTVRANTVSSSSALSVTTKSTEDSDYPNAILEPIVIEQVLQARKDARNNQLDFLRCHGIDKDIPSVIEQLGGNRSVYSDDHPTAGMVSSTGKAKGIQFKAMQLSQLTPIHRKYLQQRHSGLLKWLTTVFGSSISIMNRSSTNNIHNDSADSFGSIGSSGSIVQQHRLPFPVYFQHDGHSRTLIGWEIRPAQSSGSKRKVEDSNVASLSGIDNNNNNGTTTEPTKKRKTPVPTTELQQPTLHQYLPIVNPTAPSTGPSISDNDTNGTSISGNEANMEDPSSLSKEENDVEIFLLMLDPITEPRIMRSALHHPVEVAASLSSTATGTGTGSTSFPILTSVPSSSGNDRKKSSNWRQIIKRGLHTFHKTVYEAVYVPIDAVPVPIGSKEWEELKIVKEQHYWSGYDKFSLDAVLPFSV